MDSFITDETEESIEPVTVESKPEGKPLYKKSQVAVRLPRTLFNKFRRYVEKTGMSQTDVMVTALAQYLDSSEGVPMLHKILELEKRVEALEDKHSLMR